jgi:NADP-dependent 3-hydroxy acid dehydrogenase YdfG
LGIIDPTIKNNTLRPLGSYVPKQINEKMNDFVALITGASRGIGAACATALAAKGYRLGLMARNRTDLEALQSRLNTESISLSGSVDDAEFVQKAIAQVYQTFGRLDLVVINAGVGSFGGLEQLTEQDFDTMMAVNVKGRYLVSKAVIPHMKEAEKGQLIFIASDVSKRTFAGGAAYCASKYAQHALADALRKELRSNGIKTGVIYPGMTATNFAGGDPEEQHKRSWLQPEDIADALVYMATAPSHVTIDEILLHPAEQDW